MPMQITVNGFHEKVPDPLTLAELIELFQETDRDLIVELNGRFVFSHEYGTVRLAPGDRVEFINPNFGG
jgi:thiamine biosynthesis protein ThiS